MPPVLFFSVFKSGINQVAADYQNMKNLDPNDLQSTPNKNFLRLLSKDLRHLPFLDKIFGQYMPTNELFVPLGWAGANSTVQKFCNSCKFGQRLSIDIFTIVAHCKWATGRGNGCADNFIRLPTFGGIKHGVQKYWRCGDIRFGPVQYKLAIQF